jgi:nitrogen fixation NifU-like protein
MSELDDLYQEMILDHSKRPRNFHEMEGATAVAHGHNPLCGDRVTVYVKLIDGKIDDVAFTGQGCAISTASASILTETLKGKTPAEAEALFARFHEMVTGDAKAIEDAESLGKLAVFAGVSEFPIRVKCASLPWHTFKAALHQEVPGTISTE